MAFRCRSECREYRHEQRPCLRPGDQSRPYAARELLRRPGVLLLLRRMQRAVRPTPRAVRTPESRVKRFSRAQRAGVALAFACLAFATVAAVAVRKARLDAALVDAVNRKQTARALVL